MPRTYLFDVRMFAQIRVPAETADGARSLLRSHVNQVTLDCGHWPNGEPVQVTLAIAPDDELGVIEVQDNTIQDDGTKES